MGDLHGRYDDLMEELNLLDFNFDKDKLFAVGDLIDRGPKSWECLQLTYEPYFHSVVGNHCQIMYDALARGQEHLWIQNGGGWWYDSGHDQFDSHKQEAIDIIVNLPNYMTLTIGDKQVGIIHASANGRVWPPKQTSLDPWGDPTIWCRKFLSGTVPKVEGVDLVICGHNPTSEPKLENTTLHIDTGYKSGKLTVLNLEEILGD